MLVFIFLIDPTENYVEWMRFEYFSAVIDNSEPLIKYKRYLYSWRKMYDNEIA